MDTSNSSQNINGAPIDMASNVPKKTKSNPKKKIMIIASVFIALMAIIFIGVNTATEAPLKVSDKLISSLKGNKPSEAYALFSADAKGTITEDAFADTVDKISPYLVSKPVITGKEINSSTDTGETSKITYEIKDDENNTYIIAVELIKNNDKWEIQYFESTKKK